MGKKEFKKTKLEFINYEMFNSISDENTKEFFLALGLIFNDFMDSMWSFNCLEEYRFPIDSKEKTSHFGKYSGLQLYHIKNFLSIINETIIFLEKEKTRKIVASDYIQNIINSSNFNSSQKEGISGLFSGITDFVFLTKPQKRLLVDVRNNFGSHYPYEYRGYLCRGFSNSFNSDNSNIYFDLITGKEGGNIDSRIYYVDASIQGFLNDSSENAVDVFKELSLYVISTLGLFLDEFHKSFLDIKNKNTD